MKYFNNPYTNPYFNLASEEFMLNRFPEGFVMLWQNQNTVVVGKHQNALAEVDFPYIYENKIHVARRISGGGTVFHDQGNLNFTIALPVGNSTNIIDFRKFIDPVIAYLNSLNVPAWASGRNDIMAGDFKISGNAEHHFRKQKIVLHHGTLLFNSDLGNLGKAIKGKEGRYFDKAVQSKRSTVANISQFLSEAMSLTDFREGLKQYLVKHFNVNEIRDFNCAETDEIEALAVSKFEKDDWNLGYSPAYKFETDFEWENSMGEIKMDVERNSLIREIKINHPNPILSSDLSEKLKGKSHFPKTIDKWICHTFAQKQEPNLHPLTLSFF